MSCPLTFKSKSIGDTLTLYIKCTELKYCMKITTKLPVYIAKNHVRRNEVTDFNH